MSTSPSVAARGILDSYRAAQRAPPSEEQGDLAEACPVECVREITKKSELEEALAAAEARVTCEVTSSATSSSEPPSPGIVVVDFYKRACGACKYIAPGFVKLCKAASSVEGAIPDVVFLKHNVETDGEGGSDDEGDDAKGRTALAASLDVRSVPLFHVYRGRELVASFATRDRKRVAEAINDAVGRHVL